MAVIYTQALLEQIYRGGTVDAPVLGPTRAFYQGFSANQQLGWWENLRSQRVPPGLLQNFRILVVGCGFGFLIEKLLDAGFESVWGVDSASYYFDASRAFNFDPRVRPRVAQLDVRNMTQQDRRNMTGANQGFDAVITESVMEGYAPAEQDAILAACEAQRQGNRPIAHIVFDGVDMSGLGGSPARTLEEWQASTARPGHTFVSAMEIEGS